MRSNRIILETFNKSWKIASNRRSGQLIQQSRFLAEMNTSDIIETLDPSFRPQAVKSICEAILQSKFRNEALCDALAGFYSSGSNKNHLESSKVLLQGIIDFMDRTADDLDNLAGIEPIASLVRKIPSFQVTLIEKSNKIFEKAISNGLLRNFGSFNSDRQFADPAINEKKVLRYLHLIFMLNLTDAAIKTVPLEMIINLSILHGSRSLEIASMSNKALGKLMRPYFLTPELQEKWWKIIQLLLETQNGNEYHVLGFRLWLRWVSRDSLSDNKDFQLILDDGNYWKFLQDALQQKFTYSCKKFGLYILSHSIQVISHDISTDVMTWKMDQSERYRAEWNRYVTLVEIISLDTSINQVVASKNDILIMLDAKKSIIPNLWGQALVCIGLKSNMTSIRNFMGDLVLNMNPIDNVLQNPSEATLECFLDFCTTASRFNTVDYGDKVICEQVEILTKFISRLISSTEGLNFDRLIENILLYVSKNENKIYEPAAISLIMGLAEGIGNRRMINSGHMKWIKNILEIQCFENDLRQKAMTAGCIRLINRVDASQVEFTEWFSFISSITKSRAWIKTHMMDEIVKTVSQNWGMAVVDSIDMSDLKLSDAGFYLSFYYEYHTQFPDDFSFLSPENLVVILAEAVKGCHKKLLSHQPFLNYVKSNWHILYKECEGRTSDELYSAVKNLNAIIPESTRWYIDASSGFDLPSDSKELNWSLQQLAISRILREKIDILEFVKLFRSKNIFIAGLSHHDREIMTLGYFGCLAQYSDISEPEFEEILEDAVFFFPQVQDEAKHCILECLEKSLISKFNEGYFNEKLVAELPGMWNAIIKGPSNRRQKGLAHLFLAFAFSDANLATDSSHLLEKMARSVLKDGFKRRALIPQLAQKLYPNHTCNWIKYIMVSIYASEKNKAPTYQIEPVVGELIDDLLELPHGTTYDKEWGIPESCARALAIAYIANLDKISSTELFDYFMSGKDYKPFQILRRNGAGEKRIKVAILQLMLILERNLPAHIAERALRLFFWPSLDPESSLGARIYIEWFIARHISKASPDVLEEEIFKPLLKYDGLPRVVVSLERIGLLVLNCEKDDKLYAKLVSQYLNLIMPLATSNKAGVRHSSVAMMHSLRIELDKPEKTEFRKQISTLIPIMDGIIKAALNHDNESKFRKGTDNTWDLNDDFTLVGIAGGVLVKVLDECPIMPLTRSEFTTALEPFGTDNLQIPVGNDFKDVWRPPSKENADIMRHELENYGLSQLLQTKSGAWKAFSDEKEEENKRMGIKRGHMTIVATLVDKAPNLGGICRLCDVLGAELLCLNDMRTTETKDFKSVAMTADLWMPMTEVKEEDISEFMTFKKEQGYTLIGLEQTDNSVQLNAKFEFPEKCVLLLGKEREGIPGNLLAELDFCVEIKQVGVVRSMNIQTAAAIVVQAYSAQHC